MTGQDAVNSADEFHKKLTLTGVVLTKMDGDARGGAALSIRNVTGQPIKFIGIGEKYDALEPFHPDRIVGRILGMGDILSLIEKAEDTRSTRRSREEFAAKALSGDGFSLEDFRDQLRQVKKLGSLQSIMGMLPKIGPLRQHAEGRRQRGREGAQPRRSHHQLDDAVRARAPRVDQRQPAQAHRPRLRHQRAGSEPPAAPVRADAQDVQEHGQAQLRQTTRRNENARDVVNQNSRGPRDCVSLSVFRTCRTTGPIRVQILPQPSTIPMLDQPTIVTGDAWAEPVLGQLRRSTTRASSDLEPRMVIKTIRMLLLSFALLSAAAPLVAQVVANGAEKATPQLSADNPFVKPSTLPYEVPAFDKIKDEHFRPAFEAGMAEHKKEIQAIAHNPEPPTFENTIVAMREVWPAARSRLDSVLQPQQLQHQS